MHFYWSDRHPQLNNIFNGLLLWLAIFDNCFMVSCLLENIWRHYGGVWHYVFIIGYCFILYPFKNFALTCITNTQVSLSIERFKAIRYVIIDDIVMMTIQIVRCNLFEIFINSSFETYISKGIRLNTIATIPTHSLGTVL